MSDDNYKKLAERIVATPGWCWLPGMVAVDADGDRWRKLRKGWCHDLEGTYIECDANDSDDLPDLHDEATRGAVLILARWYHHNGALRTTRVDGRWFTSMPGAEGFDSELEALVVALEAPQRFVLEHPEEVAA